MYLQLTFNSGSVDGGVYTQTAEVAFGLQHKHQRCPAENGPCEPQTLQQPWDQSKPGPNPRPTTLAVQHLACFSALSNSLGASPVSLKTNTKEINPNSKNVACTITGDMNALCSVQLTAHTDTHTHTLLPPSLTLWLFIWTSESLFPPICTNPSSLRGRKLVFVSVQWQKCLLTSTLNISDVTRWALLHVQPVLWINIILKHVFVESVCCWMTFTVELKEWTTDTEISVCTSVLDSSSLHSTSWGGLWAKMPQIKTECLKC